MYTPTVDAGREVSPDGIVRWLLREAVRANPLYVISAALLAYALQQLMIEIDPQIGRLGGVIASQMMLHAYEFAVLLVATVVLKQRTRAGLDMHGLLIVGALYMGVTFIALDELVAIRPHMGMIVASIGLAAVAVKLTWYARLPGVYLPLQYRLVVLVILGAHELSPFLNSRELSIAFPPIVAQGLGWFVGWISLLSIVWLVCFETLTNMSNSGTSSVVTVPDDPLATRTCGAWLVCLAALASIVHIFVTDWIFDRPSDNSRLWPAATVLAAAVVLLRWRRGSSFNFFDAILIAAPVLILEELWRSLSLVEIRWQWEFLLSPAMQTRVASVIFYCAVAWGTGRARFYFGLSGPLAIPFFTHAWKSRDTIPHFRALVSACMGFVTLGLGMILSLFRERMLRWLGVKR